MYLVYNKSEFSHNGDFPGTRFVGSSNFTYKEQMVKVEKPFAVCKSTKVRNGDKSENWRDYCY